MKKSFVLLTSYLSIMNFSFWELDGPFGQYIENSEIMDEKNKQLIHPIQRLNKDSQLINNTFTRKGDYYGYLFLYNFNTGYSIGCIKNIMHSNQRIVDFFLGNNDIISLKSKNNGSIYSGEEPDVINFYFIKEKSNLLQEGSRSPNLGSYYYDLMKDKVVDNKLNALHANSEFMIVSNIYIANREEGIVKIIRNDQEFNFQSLLFNYFNKQKKTQDLIKNMVNSIPNKEELNMRILNNLKFSTRLGEKVINQLKNSTVLAVYTVIKNRKNQNAIIWGLAQDDSDLNKKRFHWITDLEDDFSVLLD